ncbi:MAG TPA: hypothetical protein VHN11_01975 [Xanthobacteraceae bacterium]|jgi:hypothetical protein|nr:hypothetical protein [Xanthobacteraceae bacterium]
MDLGKTALPGAAEAAGELLVGRCVEAFGEVGPVVGVVLAWSPHSVLRNSFQDLPLSVPADFAAWYLVLHSFVVRAYAGAASIIAPEYAARQITTVRMVMGSLVDDEE